MTTYRATLTGFVPAAPDDVFAAVVDPHRLSAWNRLVEVVDLGRIRQHQLMRSEVPRPAWRSVS